MANKFYPLGLQHFAQGDIAFLTDTIKVALVAQPYTFSATDQFVSNLTAGSPAISQIVARSGAVTGKSAAAGVLSGNVPNLTAVSGAPVYYVVLYKDTGSDATSPLIVYYDTGTNLPLTPNGGDISATFSSPNFFGAI
jgi:hypothetical protein